jgi:methylthioribose-1-phosphate isomerase
MAPGGTTIKGLPTLLRESVLLESDRVRILDRRIFPASMEWVDCLTYEDVAIAIETMVTQSGGPFFAASAAMILAARVAEAETDPQRRRVLMSAAGERMVQTRPTNNSIRDVVARILDAVRTHERDRDFSTRLLQVVEDIWATRRTNSRRIGENAASLIGDGETILTHCWPESGLAEMIVAVLKSGKQIKAFCTETRPYLQGARLTAHSLAEMGVDVTVITDGMAAHAMSQGMISRLVTSADRVTLSGHVVNKIGTLQLAIAAHRYAVPYIAMVSRPDRLAPDPSAVEMEDRDGNEVLECFGQRTASPLVKGWYPAFDITPPELVSALATSEGVFSAWGLRQHFSQ